ncbi:hypothetical protein [Asticcacaulis solisilvae]|uniref:hypothetical protein n=1 Tax=Asticcacaulis solisilvae TaxID=1217274 RepID=UPI003FD8D1A3
MKIAIAAAMAAGTLLAPLSASALQPWDFGRVAYGKELHHPPKWGLHVRCDKYDGACTFKDGDGIEYTTWPTWDDQIVEKVITLTPRQRYLPFGIQRNDDWQSVIRKAASKTGLKFECQTHAENQYVDPGERFCVAEVEPKSSVALEFAFGRDGRLKTISISTQYT